MTPERLREFVGEVSALEILPDDLDRIGARAYCNQLIDDMDKAYGKDAKIFNERWKAIVGILKQAKFRSMQK